MTSSLSPIGATKLFVRQHLVAPVQARVASRRLANFVESTRNGVLPDSAAISRLRRAWGNEAYSADAAYIAEVITQCSRCSGPILECGSGLTTLVAAIIAERRNETVWSLEQDPEWARFVGHRLDANEVTNAKVIYAPLKNYGDFVWYDLEGVVLPPKFGLALCDGPAVFPHWGDAHRQWRFGLLPVLSQMKIDMDVVLLDDADEPRASKLLERWMSEFELDYQMLNSDAGCCAVLVSR